MTNVEAGMKAEREVVAAAYEFVQPSYEMLVGRLDAAEGRIQNVLGFAASLMVAAPVLAEASRGAAPDFTSVWFAAGVLAFLLIFGAAIWARVRSQPFKLVSIATLYEQWLGFPTADSFKLWMTGYAAKHFRHNEAMVNKRAELANGLSIVLGGQALLLVLWLIGFAGL